MVVLSSIARAAAPETTNFDGTLCALAATAITSVVIEQKTLAFNICPSINFLPWIVLFFDVNLSKWPEIFFSFLALSRCSIQVHEF
jgi:hypothetical protein